MTDSSLDQLRQYIEQAGNLLPTQGPLDLFVSLNTLAAFEELPFDEGVIKGSEMFGCQPYLAEDRYRREFERGRILQSDLREILRRDLAEKADVEVVEGCSRLDLRLAMMEHALRMGPPAELHWFVAETDALTKFRGDVTPAAQESFIKDTRHWVMRDLFDGAGKDDSEDHAAPEWRAQHALASLLEYYDPSTFENWSDSTWATFCLQSLWRVCRNGVHGLKPPTHKKVKVSRHRDLLLAATGEDSDRLMHELLIRYCGAFLDQGFSPWPMPFRELGFFGGFCALYGQPAGQPDRWLRGLEKELQTYNTRKITPLESIKESLVELGIAPPEWEAFLTATMLGLRGWAGMVRELETRADRAIVPVPKGSLIEFMAVYLILERRALKRVAHQALKYDGLLSGLRDACEKSLPVPHDQTLEQRAFIIFQLAQVMGWLPEELFRWPKSVWANLIREIESFPQLDRRRLFHHAYERRYYTQSLDAFSVCAARPLRKVPRPSFQVICCIDDREESFRRHIEEVDPTAETLSAAGFFSVAMFYRGAGDAHHAALCPIIMVPKHWVEEDVVYTEEDVHRRRAVTRKALGKASHHVHIGSRTIAGGALLTAGFGFLATIPLVARVLFPRLTSRVRRAVGTFMKPPKNTNLQLERTEPTPGPEEGHIGFSLQEMTDISERVLRDLGIYTNLSRIVIFAGHGSSSLNNPHNAAYNCGACSGGEGGPNARALSQMLNDPRVREGLVARNIQIPEDTIFVGAFHNTCNDSVTYYALDRIPKSHHKDLAHAQAKIEEACNRNAHERCRRFVSAPLTLSFVGARRHVENRSEDLSQTRPEVGHSTTALTYVGRRERCRGLYMDRRAFLNSYDPSQDDAESNILLRILSAAVPVCGGINLQYLFSYIDSSGWGCGTKLPHNVTGLLGVMDGPASDLRTGLPWQGVEIHEPVRNLFVIETTPAAMLSIMGRNEVIGRMCRNGWVQVSTLDPNSNQLHVYRGGKFEPYHPEDTELPDAQASVDWYRGWRENLGYAMIKAALPLEEGSNGNGHVHRNGHGQHSPEITKPRQQPPDATATEQQATAETLQSAGARHSAASESDA